MDIQRTELERLVAFTPGSTAVFQMADHGLRMLLFSSSISSFLGLSGTRLTEVLQKDCLGIVEEADRPRAAEAASNCISSGHDRDVQLRVERKDGTAVWVHLLLRRIGDYEGYPLLVGTFSDLSDETATVDRLLDHFDSIMYICDADSLELLYANATARAYWGRSDYLGCTCYEFIQQRDSPCPWCSFPKLKGKMLHTKTAASPENRRAYSIDLIRLEYHGHSAIAVVAEEFSPTTALQASSGFRQPIPFTALFSIINTIPAGICVLSEKNGLIRTVAVNEAVCTIKGAKSSELRRESGEKIFDRIHPEDREYVETEVRQLFSKHKKLCISYRSLNGTSGQYRTIRLEGRASAEEDGSNTAYLVYSDVTLEKEVELALKKDERIYSLAIGLADLLLWHYDPAERRAVFLSRRSDHPALPFGALPRSIENFPEAMLPYIEPSETKRFLSMYDDIAAGKPLIRGEFRFHTPNSSKIYYISITYTVIRDDDGRNELVYGIAQDISAKKKAEEEYLEELQFLKGNEENNLIAKAHHNLSANRIIAYFAKSNKALDVKQDRSYSEAVADLLLLPSGEGDRAALADMLDRSRLISRYFEGRRDFQLEYNRAKPGQPPIWVLTIVHSFQMPSSGDIECFIYTYDITSRRLENSIINRMTQFGFDYIGLLDPESGNFSYYNESRAEGAYKSGEIMDYDKYVVDTIHSIVPRDEWEFALNAFSIKTIRDELEKRLVYSFSYDRVEASGLPKRKRMQYSYLDSSREIILFSRSDITEQYEHDREQLRQLKDALCSAEKANEAKSVFLSNISHDLRTPLNGIIGFTNLALAEDNPEKKQAYLGKISLSGKLLIDLINDTLDLSKIESGKIVLSPEVISFHELFDNVILPLKSTAEAKGIEFVYDSTKTGFDFVRTDRVNTQKILLNLISNAIKFTPPGGKVEVKIEELPPSAQANCRISVIDSGIGISREFMPKIYEPFAQEKRPESNAIPGTGLGLSIVKHLVDMMRGSIEAQSEEGKGTSFTVYLPIEKSARGPAAPVAASSAPVSSLEGRIVLVCEDNELNAEIARTCLETRRIRVLRAANGQEAIEQFAASPEGTISAVLMDLRMPVMDGFEATQKIRSMNRGDSASVPIIAMSADAYEEDVKKCLSVGMNSHIAKPIDFNRLFAELENLCR